MPWSQQVTSYKFSSCDIYRAPPFGEEILWDSWLRMCDSPFIVKLYETYNSSSAQEKRANGRPLSRDGFCNVRSGHVTQHIGNYLENQEQHWFLAGFQKSQSKKTVGWWAHAGYPWVSGSEHLYLLLELALGGELYATCLGLLPSWAGQLRSSSPRAIGDDLVGDWNHGILNDFPWKVGNNGL